MFDIARPYNVHEINTLETGSPSYPNQRAAEFTVLYELLRQLGLLEDESDEDDLLGIISGYAVAYERSGWSTNGDLMAGTNHLLSSRSVRGTGSGGLRDFSDEWHLHQRLMILRRNLNSERSNTRKLFLRFSYFFLLFSVN